MVSNTKGSTENIQKLRSISPVGMKLGSFILKDICTQSMNSQEQEGAWYIGAGLQYIGAPKFYFQDSGNEWRGRVLIKPGFVYHMMV